MGHGGVEIKFLFVELFDGFFLDLVDLHIMRDLLLTQVNQQAAANSQQSEHYPKAGSPAGFPPWRRDGDSQCRGFPPRAVLVCAAQLQFIFSGRQIGICDFPAVAQISPFAFQIVQPAGKSEFLGIQIFRHTVRNSQEILVVR